MIFLKTIYAIINLMTEDTQETKLTPEEIAAQKQALAKQRWMAVGIIVGVIIFLALIGLAIYALTLDPDTTSNIRDIFIIFMALESLLIGAALVILITQIASLINLIQNEIRPILDATNETVNTLRGTTTFLSENLVEPVIKLNSYLAGFRRFFELFGVKTKK